MKSLILIASFLSSSLASAFATGLDCSIPDQPNVAVRLSKVRPGGSESARLRDNDAVTNAACGVNFVRGTANISHITCVGFHFGQAEGAVRADIDLTKMTAVMKRPHLGGGKIQLPCRFVLLQI